MQTEQNSYPELAQALGISDIILKREDLHPYGSHKGRSIPYMIEEYIKKGYSDFVISSSGNAALAAIYTAKEKNINLKVFVGKNIADEKLRRLKSEIRNPKSEISIEQVENPKQQAFLEAKNNPSTRAKSRYGASKNTINLRQSTDDLALKGYKTLVEELEKIDNLKAIFIPTSSGTTAQALAGLDAQIHIVQTTSCHPFVKDTKYKIQDTKTSIANAIVDRIAHRKNKVIEIIKNSGGYGWVVNDEEIQNAIKLVKEKTDIDISPNSALSIAGLQKAIKNDWQWDGPVVCLITGK